MNAAPTEAFSPHPQPAADKGAAGAAGTADGNGRRAEAAARPGLLATIRSMAGELPGLFSDRLDLLTLELQRSARALAQIVVLLVALSILGVTVWLALWVGIGIGLVELGLHWALSMAVVLALNAGVALLAFVRMRGLLPLLRLPATRRHLRPGSVQGQDPAPSASPSTAATSTTSATSTASATSAAPVAPGAAGASAAAARTH